VSQSSEFCHYNPLCCFSKSVYCLFCYQLSPETFGYTLVFVSIVVHTCFHLHSCSNSVIPEGSSPCSQKPIIGLCPEVVESTHYFFKIHFGIICPSTSGTSTCFLPLSLSDQKFICIYHFFHAYYMLSYLILLHLVTLMIVSRVHIMEHLII
jgi:hypothetical protein